ncbi:lipopolysaccharide ABC transporter permease LptF [Enterobacter asburiae]|uniref:Lipopolysaccharide ABC transporter permease LptF n=1 Tax=Enterobacter asburiae TaxID=61645 RepID=A0A376FHM9_ENTAS|nr:lipopolysaccharide ABC transporter permease LptF [Enterobacter asburiae]
MAQLILPLSLFLGLLMTLGKLYTESEITVMHACGLSKAVLVKAAMILALFTGIVRGGECDVGGSHVFPSSGRSAGRSESPTPAWQP